MNVVFLADLHVTASLTPPQESLLDWLKTWLARAPVDLELYGGDLLQVSRPEPLQALLARLDAPAPGRGRFWLPGNRDATIGRLVRDPAQGCGEYRLLKQRAAQVLLLNTESPEATVAGLEALRRGFLRRRPILVASHRAPDEMGSAVAALMAEISRVAECLPLWLAGHNHVWREVEFRGWRCVTTPGLDAARVIRTAPEFLQVEVAGRAGWSLKRITIPESVLWPALKRKITLGIAPIAPVSRIFSTACAQRIDAVQLRGSLVLKALNRSDRLALTAWRRQFPRGLLSIHLPNIDPENAEALRQVSQCLRWGKRFGVGDYTAHLPDHWHEHEFFAPDGQPVDARAERALQVYVKLARQALGSGAQLSLENMHNAPGQVQSSEPDLLSSRPWHLRSFVELLRRHLQKHGVSRGQLRRVGVLFDVGHARNNGRVSKELAPLNWLPELADLIQCLHVHQVLATENGMKNHFPITHAGGPLINYAGILACLASLPGPACRAFVEVRNLQDAVASYQTLSSLRGVCVGKVRANG